MPILNNFTGLNIFILADIECTAWLWTFPYFLTVNLPIQYPNRPTINNP